MTNAEAIQMLEKFQYHESWDQYIIDKVFEALNMAISALQAQDVPDINVGDMVSRQAAIGIVRFECGEWKGLSKTIENGLNRLPSAQPEPCDDAVNRADMLETYADLYDVFEDNNQIRKELNKVYDKLNALPSVTPKRKNGKWLDNYQYGYKCSECGAYLEIDCGDVEMNFCPNCGADMRGK